MTEILFYQLERAPLERVLPDLLEKSLERGWRAIVQAGSVERMQALDASLWTYEESSFLPHGTDDQDHAPHQPVLLTVEGDNRNEAHIRFLVDGADIDDVSSYIRVIYMFNGRNEDELSQARKRWKAYKDSEHELTYWAQNETGKWEKKG
jgi:DNA polymerase III subunit chi